MKDFKTIKLMWNQLIYILNKEQKKNMFLMFFVILIGAILETLGVSIMLPFMQMLITPDKLLEKEYIRFCAGLLNIQGVMEITVLTGLAIIIVYFFKNIGLTISAYLQTRYSMGLVKQLSYQMMESYMSRPYQFFVDGSSGEIIRGVSGDVLAIQSVILNIFKFMSETLVVICIGIYVITADPMMALGILFICAACFFSIIYGIKDIFVRQKRKTFLDKYDMVNEKACKANTWNMFVGLLPERIIETMCIGGIITVVLFRIVMGINNEEFIPMLAIFAVAAFRILPSISRITGYVNGFIFQRPALEAAYENIRAAREYIDSTTQTSRDNELENMGLSFHN